MFIPALTLKGISQTLQYGYLKDSTGTIGEVCNGVANTTGYSTTYENPPKSSLHARLWGEKRTTKSVSTFSIYPTDEAGADYRFTLEGDGWYNFYMGVVRIYSEADRDANRYVNGQLLWDSNAEVFVRISAIQIGVGAILTPVQVEDIKPAEFLAVGTCTEPIISHSKVAALKFFNAHVDDCECDKENLEKASKMLTYMEGVCLNFQYKTEYQGQKAIELLVSMSKPC